VNRRAALEVGGSHVAAAWVDTGDWAIVDGTYSERDIDPNGAAEHIAATIADAARDLGAPTGRLTIAIPGPFDYDDGIGRFSGVGKFEALNGFDLRAALRSRLNPPPDDIAFLNDAAAFGIGEWANGAAAGSRRTICVTLGTGVGSAFLADGEPVTDGETVPPEGRVDLLSIGAAPLEERVSTRAIVRAYGSANGVHQVVAAARRGDAHARDVLSDAFMALGATLAPWVLSFDADALVIGGKIATAWPEVAPPLTSGLRSKGVGVEVHPARRPTESGLIGAAHFGARVSC
jgi:glucokinase